MPDYSVQTLTRALDIVDTVADGETISVSDVAARLGLHKSTVSRLLAALRARGWVQQNGASRYSLGPRLLALGRQSIRRPDLRKTARPYLEELQRRTGEDIHLGVLSEGQVLCVDRVDSSHMVRMFFATGSGAPAHATALGKAMLAFLDAELLQGIVRTTGLPRLTRHTITDPTAFDKELAVIRKRGYAIDDRESTDEVRCVGAPIFGDDARVVGALSVSGPAFRLARARAIDTAEDVLATARAISEQLGGRSRV